MKKLIICLIAIVFITLICIAKSYNMPNEKDVEFYGDNDFINKISEDNSDALVSNAILCYGEGMTEKEAINNVFIENNDIYNNITGWCEAISVAGNAKYINIVNNTVHDNTNIGIDFYGNAGYCLIPSAA